MEAAQFQTPPRTVMQVFKMLPECTLAELINGTLYISPAPTKSHQRLVKALAFAISTVAESEGIGEVFLAPYDVFLDEKENAVQPDLLFVLKEKSFIAQEDGAWCA
jgi:Uma2 family endonuclease